MNLDELRRFGKRDYEYPKNDHHSVKRTNLMKHLLIILHLHENLRDLTDKAFEALDKDGSGDLDQDEIGFIMNDVANHMKVKPPSRDELRTILTELDNDYDGKVDRNEFNQLLMLVIKRMIETEMEIQEKVNSEI